ncbi:spermatogenesis-associated protein 20 isoform X2 [Coccinella septempunctata]|nr:spermatogenesis-associated protein 20 isoform X2 [Coccinella septempunctata]
MSDSDSAAGTSQGPSDVPEKNVKKNRLILEKSPYLLQHATNPVDWYPWGEEAFEKARKENKVIFLSVGYSTCHWCHVMEKESFENESTAEIMNKHFVNIKVDREERPDVDKMYMTFIQATVGNGGWPMSVFLTPNLEPLTGGTYFPPEDMLGRPGFKTVLKNIAQMWGEKKTTMETAGMKTVEVLRKLWKKDLTSGEQGKISVPNEKCVKKCLLQYERCFDDEFGGFSSAPKFPQPSNFSLLFHIYSRDRESPEGILALEMCLKTLKKIAYGGIHDHVNSGFARYSVDNKWHVPHFEKMLYDNAQLAVSYCDAFVVTKDQFFSEVVNDILTYVSRDLSHELGGFYGAEDADSYPTHGAAEKKEGAFCVWEYSELEELLQYERENIPVFKLFAYHFGVMKSGNVPAQYDPHGELLKKNILCCFGSYEKTASKYNISVSKLKEILREALDILYEERQKRPKPITDTKMITAWQGLMISGYAKAGFALKEQKYINRAILAANFIKKFLYDEETKSLWRCCYRGDSNEIVQINHPIKGFLDDYAFLIRGLLDLYEASLDSDWLQWAEVLQETQDRLFWDPEGMGYFSSPAGDASIKVRGKEDQDGAEPCGNSVSVHNLLRLAAYLDRQDLKSKAGRTLTAFSERLSTIPMALPEMMSGLLLYHNAPTQVFIAGETGDRSTEALLDVLRCRLIPGRVLAVTDGPGGKAGILYKRHETLARLRPVGGKPAAYVCRNFACSLPVTDPEELASSLDAQCSLSNKPSISRERLEAFQPLSSRDCSSSGEEFPKEK